MDAKLEVTKTSRGNPALWVGGGATTSKFSARFVMRAGRLARACFIARHGHRCNAGQALVPLLEGDIVIELSGRRPATADNPDLFILARRIISFEDDNQHKIAIVEYVDVSVDDVPPSVEGV